MSLFLCYLIVSPCTLSLELYCPGTHGTSMGSPLASLVGQLCLEQIFFSTLPHRKSTIESTSVVSPPMKGIACVWQTCDDLSRVLFTLYFSLKLCTGTTRCTGRCTGQPTNQRYWGVSFAMLQNSCILMRVGSSFFLSFTLVEQVHHH